MNPRIGDYLRLKETDELLIIESITGDRFSGHIVTGVRKGIKRSVTRDECAGFLCGGKEE